VFNNEWVTCSALLIPLNGTVAKKILGGVYVEWGIFFWIEQGVERVNNP
jgi:hypothetical protein